MSKTNVGEVSAYFPASGPNKSYYRKIGNLFREVDSEGAERLSIKLDMMPVGAKWEGWCNVFPPGEKPKVGKAAVADLNYDIPF